MPTRASAPRFVFFARALQLLFFALAVGIPCGLIRAALDALPYSQTRDLFPTFLLNGLQLCIAIGVGVVVVWVIVYRIVLARIGARRSARLATLISFAAPAYFIARRVNSSLLPAPLELASLVGNTALLAGMLIAGYLAHRHLLHWQQDTWRTGRTRRVALLVLALIPAGAYVYGTAPRDPAPDVLVLTVDILRADHLGCYGYARATSPNIDALAADAIVFENAISPSTFTKASVASMFTGVNPHSHGVFKGTVGINQATGAVESDILSDRFTTLAEGMYEHGLNTMAWVQNGQLRSYMGFAQGFTSYFDQPGSIERIAPHFDRWLELWGDAARYFAYLHFLDLHGPFNPKPPFRGAFGGGSSSITGMDRGSWLNFKQGVVDGDIVLTEADLHELEARHDEVLLYTDSWIGRILDRLRETGRYDNTLIVLTSDHGEAFWEHGFISHSNRPYEELCHVPLIIKLPKSAQAGRRIPDTIGMIDLAPTLLDYVGATPPAAMTGESFLSLLTDASASIEPRTRYVEVHYVVALRTDRWKYIHRDGTETELFDLTADPGETINRIADFPEVAEDMQRRVDAARQLREAAHPAERVTVDDETRDALQAIGYGS